MSELPSFEMVTITNDNYHNGGYATYSFELTPRVILYNDDSLSLTFPPELTLPAVPVCTGGNLLKNITCTSPAPNRLKIEFFFKTPVLAENFRITFKVKNIRNSPNTKITLPFYDIEAYDNQGRKISVYAPVGPQMKNIYVSVA